MNPSGTSSEPPEEPYLRSEPSVLSPASPKPFLFPQPTNIPVLEMQMDVGFNQTEVHMSDPSTRNTELRPDAWRDPNEIPSPSADQAVNAPIASGDPQPLPLSSETVHVPIANAAKGTTDPSHEHVLNDLTAAHLASSEALPKLPDSSSAVSLPLPLPGVLSPHPTPSNHTPQASDGLRDTPLQPQAPQTPSTAHVQSLLDNLQTSLSVEAVPNPFPAAEGPNAPIASTFPSIEANDRIASVPNNGGGAIQADSMAGLPPRPPPQEQPLIHPNYSHSNIRDYHPHATNGEDVATVSNTYPKDPLGAPAKALVPGEIAPRLTSSRGRALATNSPLSPDDTPWGPDIQSKYDAFLTAERDYVNEARWEQFPAGSRLFIGNLSSDRVTKRDIFHVFHHYGPLAQISIKQAYGFVQFLKKEDCERALAAEQGRQIREKRVHLEISKPQKSKGGGNVPSRRSRSPEGGPRGGRGAVDRYASGRGSDRNGNNRDEYRSRGGYQRSPSPRGYRDRHDDRNGGYNRNGGGHRQRSRSPPYSSRGGDEDRYSSFYSRSPPPPRGARSRNEDEDDLPLPRRDPRDVPDVQILVHGELQRDFLSWVEAGFTAKSLRVGTLRLAPRLSEEAVVRRQILEGVVAVVKLRRSNQDTGRIGLIVFKRDGAGRKDVRFEEYDNLDPAIAAELVLRERGSTRPQQSQYPAPTFGYNAVGSPASGGAPFAPSSFAPPGFPPMPPPPQSTYGYSGQAPAYAYPPAMPAPPTASPYGAQSAQYPPAPPNVANLNPNDLQSLLRTLGQAPGSSQPPYQQQQPSAAQPPPMPGAYGSAGGYPAPYSAAGIPSAPPPQTQAPAPNMQDILARLGTYGSRG